MEVAGDSDAAVADDDVGGPDHGGDAPAPSDHRGVTDQTAAGGEDAARRLHSEHVVGCGLGANEDHVVAEVGCFDGRLGAGDDAARRRAGRCGQPGGEDGVVAVGVEAGMHERREFRRRNAQDGVGDGGVGERVARLRHGSGDQLAELVAPGDRVRCVVGAVVVDWSGTFPPGSAMKLTARPIAREGRGERAGR